jgi:hypothetical protein
VTVEEEPQKRLSARASWSHMRMVELKPEKRAANCCRRVLRGARSSKNAFPSLCRFIRGRSRMPPLAACPKVGAGQRKAGVYTIYEAQT